MKPVCQSVVTRALLSLGTVFAVWANSSAQALAQVPPQPPAPQEAPRLPRPDVATQQATLSQEMVYILSNWEKAGEITKKLEGKHRRYIYDFVFHVEKWSEGEFYYEAPDKGRIDLDAPKNFKEGQTRQRNGKNFAIQSDKAERWVCDGTQIVAIDEQRKEFQRIPIPVENRGQNITDGPLPFLFGISKEKIVMRYNITLHDNPDQGGQHNIQEGRIHLKVKPLWQQDASNWQEAEVMLDAKTYLPHAIRLIHPGGNAETVYVFYDVKRNASRNVFALWQGDPFVPRLNGYKELTPIAAQPKERK